MIDNEVIDYEHLHNTINIKYILTHYDKKIIKKVCVKKGKHSKSYIQSYCGFDIETTNIKSEKLAFMYHWQFQYNNYTFLGRTWGTFLKLLDTIKTILKLDEHTRLLCWIANMSFEFQFMRKRVNVTRVFAKKQRQPIQCEIDNGAIEFRDCLAVTGGSLKFLAETYTTTQKLKGDLDYNIIRNSKTPLSDKEKNYCINDVRILGEFSEYVFNKYIITDKYVPLTKTGILRKQVKDKITTDIKKALMLAMPHEKLYDNMMLWLFRGGYVHANIMGCDRVYEKGVNCTGVKSMDITSSYPASMEHDYFPVSQFVKLKNVSHETLEKLCKKYCVLFGARFTNIRSTTNHSIESKSKCIELLNPIIDNGRVSSADVMTVFLTELDYETYKEFYIADEMEILACWYSERGKLPNYLLSVLEHYYIKKNELKKTGYKDTPAYTIAKSKVNSFYGLTVTRLVKLDITYNGEWGYDGHNYNYYKECENMPLLAQWGVYISAHSRRKLLKMVYRIGNDVLYCDTDSIKMLNYEKHKCLFDSYNAKIIEKNKEICKKKKLPFDNFNDLGTFDDDGNYVKFKTLGAKRYIYTEYDEKEKKNKLHCTIAGLPKDALINECNFNGLDAFETFENGMEIKKANKLTTAYNDVPTYYNVDGEVMEELSSVCLYDVPFSMRLDDFFAKMITKYKEEKRC